MKTWSRLNNLMNTVLAVAFLWFAAGAEWHHLAEADEHHDHSAESAFCDAELHLSCLLCQALPLSPKMLVPPSLDPLPLEFSEQTTPFPVCTPLVHRGQTPRLRGPPALA